MKENTMTARDMVMNLGPVKFEKDYDYLQFCFALVLLFVAIAAFGWAYKVGHIDFMQKVLGVHVMAFFGFLLALGLVRGTWDVFVISKSLNAIKRASLESETLRGLLGIENFRVIDTEPLKEAVRDRLYLRIVVTQRIARLAVMFGLFGTVLGIAMSVHSLAEIRTAEDVLQIWPETIGSLGLAFFTTIAGVLVWVPVTLFHWMVEKGAYQLKERVFRIIDDHRVEGARS